MSDIHLGVLFIKLMYITKVVIRSVLNKGENWRVSCYRKSFHLTKIIKVSERFGRIVKFLRV